MCPARHHRTLIGPPAATRASAGTTLSLFSGAMGLDLGMEAANFETRAAVEVNRWAVQTIERNTTVPVLAEPIEGVETSRLLEAAGLAAGEPTVVTAGPSCQSFSTAGHRRSLGVDDGWLFKHFLRVVREAQPRFFVMEQVRGVLSAAVHHRPLAQRGPGHPILEPEEQHGSAFRLILEELAALGYYVVFGLVDAADYGSAQHRYRLVFIGSRDGEDVRLPAPTHAALGAGGLSSHLTLGEALRGLEEHDPSCRPLPPEWLKFIAQIPRGENWRSLPEELRREALGKAYDSWGGRSGFFRRLSWERPTPALTTNPAAKATMLLHPDDQRTLSVQEYARIQGFPDWWEFAGGPATQYTQIGNAVPRAIGEAVAWKLVELMSGERSVDAARLGVIACADPGLIERLNARPRTVLNPQRMRGETTRKAAVEWMSSLGGSTRLPVEVEILGAAA